MSLPHFFNSLLTSAAQPRLIRRAVTNQAKSAATDFGTMGLSLVHDLSSTVNALLLDVERLRLDSRSLEQSLRTAQQHIQGLAANRIRLGHELRICMAEFASVCENRNILLALHIDHECEVVGNAAKLQVVLNNLVRNAIDAVSGQSNASIQLRLDTSQQACISVVDNGPGISKVRQQQMFAFGYSSKLAKGHLGMGLPLVKRIVERDLGGTLQVHSTGQGTTFVITIPPVS
jgi:two-component system C4-dicarboxylate transport sensor histidine kinase DctB